MIYIFSMTKCIMWLSSWSDLYYRYHVYLLVILTKTNHNQGTPWILFGFRYRKKKKLFLLFLPSILRHSLIEINARFMKGSTAAPPPAMPNKTRENMLPKPLETFWQFRCVGPVFLSYQMEHVCSRHFSCQCRPVPEWFFDFHSGCWTLWQSMKHGGRDSLLCGW